MVQRCYLLHLIKRNCFLKMFLDDSGIFLPVFPFRTNLNGIPDDVICDIAIYADDTTL